MFKKNKHLLHTPGFGWIRENEFATRMQRIEMRAMSNPRCYWIHRDTVPKRVTPEMVCLEGGPGQGVCCKFIKKIFFI